MKVAVINSVYYGSTGKIMLSIAECGKEEHEFLLCCPKGRHNKVAPVRDGYLFGNRWSEDLHIILGRVFGLQGCFSYCATRKLINKLNVFKPDVIHLHNLHNCYINIPLLFKYIKRQNIRVIWTLHDCWAFTGHCPHFSNCEKWMNGCFKCYRYKEYPKSNIDMSRFLYSMKKKCFTGIKDLMIITPSYWLADLVKKSFLKEYNVQVINNGIDLSVFKPTESGFRHLNNCQNNKIILGVASGWSQQKGLDVFIELSKRLDETYKIVLVGTNDMIDKVLPESILSIHRTNNPQELAEIYSAADIFVNPTLEDTFPTVNIEAIACGTPVITFCTGGSPEIIDESCGRVVHDNQIDTLEKLIRECVEKGLISREACVERAKQFNSTDKFKEYIRLYEKNYESQI